MKGYYVHETGNRKEASLLLTGIFPLIGFVLLGGCRPAVRLSVSAAPFAVWLVRYFRGSACFAADDEAVTFWVNFKRTRIPYSEITGIETGMVSGRRSLYTLLIPWVEYKYDLNYIIFSCGDKEYEFRERMDLGRRPWLIEDIDRQFRDCKFVRLEKYIRDKMK